MSELNFKFEKLDGNILTVLQGKALEQKEPQKIAISGDIRSISTFLNTRKKSGGLGRQRIDSMTAVVLVDKKARTIKLMLNPEDHYGATVDAKLEESEEIKQWCINQNNTFTKEQLVKLIKFNKLFFADADKHAAMLLAFQKVQSTVNIRANDSSDDRGNKERAFVKEVTTNAPTEFILNIPIFKGFPPVTFRVEVCLDVTEGSARFWFESIELHELKIKMVDDIFASELEAAAGLVIINQ